MHVELVLGSVTILPAWKFDPVYCAGIKVGAPQVSLAALRDLHELLRACETRLHSADGTTVTEGCTMRSLATRRNALVPVTRRKSPAAPRQLDLALDDARVRGLSETEHRSASQALAHLLLEVSGVAMEEASHEHE